MSILKLVKFGGKIETFRTSGQEVLKEVINHARSCDIAVIEHPENDLRFIVGDKEIRLALEIKARTTPETIEGKFVTYLVKRTKKNEEVQLIGRVWSFEANGEVAGSSRASFPNDFVQNLIKSLSLEDSVFRGKKGESGNSHISVQGFGASIVSMLLSGDIDCLMRVAIAI